jgi:two-component system chemotaxis sensor kinase CheA
MSGDNLDPKLLALFAVEAQEAIQMITQACLLLEQEPGTAPRSDLFASILQQTHNLKGAAFALGMKEIATLTHGLESLIEALKKEDSELETAVFDLIYQTLDSLSRLSQGIQPTNLHLDLLLERLETAVTHTRSSPVTAINPFTIAPDTASGDGFPSPETIRVRTNRLDVILDLVNEVQMIRLGLEHNLTQMRHLLDSAALFTAQSQESRPVRAQFNDLHRRAETDQRHLAQLLSQLQENVHQARMLPLATVFNSLPRVARNLARELGKEVFVHMEGGDIELDRAVLEQIKSPLQHLLHNSLDHGLETPQARHAAGKEAIGQITISAVQRSSSILLEISDDGAGIDVAAIKEQAMRRRLLTAEEAQQLSEQEALWLLFQPGFSMAGALTAVSGRGVGLSIVRQAVESMHGLIFVENRPGAGVRFSLSLPVSIATSLCLLVQVESQIFALPTHQVTRLQQIRPEQLQWENGRLLLAYPETEPISALSLAHILMPNKRQTEPADVPLHKAAVLVGVPDRPVALLVDDLCDVQEMVIKKVPPPLTQLPYVAGASISGTGAVILVLSVSELIRAALLRR